MSWEAQRQAIRGAVERGDAGEAIDRFAELLASEASPRVYKLGAAVADAASADAAPAVRLRVLRTYTAEVLVEALRARAIADRLAVAAEVAGYDQIEQEIAGAPDDGVDALLLAARLTDLIPPLGRGFAALSVDRVRELSAGVVDRVTGWLPGLRERFPRALLVIAGFALPRPGSYGLADPAVELGHRRAVAAINRRIAEAVAATSSAVYADVDAVLSAVGYRAALDPRTAALARQPLSPAGVDALADHLARILGAAFTPRRKCLVLDCDNTLWGGIVGEDGIDGIALGPDYPGSAYVELQRAVLDLAGRGVILAIASKNNEADVLEVLDRHPHQVLRRDHFAAWRIDWRDKATGLREIAREIGVGLDSLVLFDDSDFECALVRQQLPEVEVIRAPAEPLELAPTVERIRSLDALSISHTDRSRGAMYRAQAERARARHDAASLDDFLESLELVLTIAPTAATQVERAAQLTARTNQLNATSRRYSPADIERMIADPDTSVFHVRLADRFGDYGICGLAIARRAGEVVELDSFLLSCRVIGRGVEDALIAFLERHAKSAGAAEIRASYRPTSRNALVSDLFDRLGFERAGEDRGEVRYRRSLESVRPYPRWFTMKAPA